MERNMFKKALVVGIIFLFIGVGVQPVFAVETKQSIINQPSVEDCDVSKNSLEITEEVEKSEVNKQNDDDCLPCVLKEIFLNRLQFPIPRDFWDNLFGLICFYRSLKTYVICFITEQRPFYCAKLANEEYGECISNIPGYGESPLRAKLIFRSKA
jgi:hypothetical protein